MIGMNIFGIGLPEMIVIMVVALLIFGPKKLPEIGKSLGKAIKGFQDASRDFQDEINKVTEPIKNPTLSQSTTKPAPETLATAPIAKTEEETEKVAEAAIEPEPIAEVAPAAETETAATKTEVAEVAEVQEQPSPAEA
jgi:sec-independent protein translocase protein TatA